MIRPLLATIFFFALTSPVSAETIKAFDQTHSLATVDLNIIEKQECVEKLETILQPEATIRSGLDALTALGAAETSPLTCLEKILGNWEKEFQTLSTETYDDSYLKVQLAIQELARESQCENRAIAGTPAFKEYEKTNISCHGRWLTPEGKSSLPKRFADLDMLSNLPKLILPHLRMIPKEKRKELQLARAAVAGPHQSVESLQEKTNSLSKLEIATQKLQLGLVEASDQYLKVVLSNGYLTDYAYDRREKIVPIFKKMICISPHEPNSPDDAFWLRTCSEYCPKGFGDQKDIPELRAQLFEALGDLKQLSAEIPQQTLQREKEHRAFLTTLIQQRKKPYETRRLLAQYYYFLKKGGAQTELEKFCLDYEAVQRRDQRINYINTPQGTPLPFNLFHSDVEWKYAQEYGFTEGELSALQAYVGEFYNVINYATRNNAFTPEVSHYKEILDTALAKIPTHSVYPLVRGSDMPAEIGDAHQVGQIVKYPAYTSASKILAMGWSGNYSAIIFSGKNGKDISELNNDEQEVLFTAGTRFKVLARENTPDGKVKLVMAEVDEAGKVIADLPVEP